MAVIRNGRIRFFAQSDVTCYILRGRQGDLLIDTGLPQTFRAMRRWMDGFDVRYVLLTYAHPDHDWNAAKLQKRGMKLILSEKDRDLRLEPKWLACGHGLPVRLRDAAPVFSHSVHEQHWFKEDTETYESS